MITIHQMNRIDADLIRRAAMVDEDGTPAEIGFIPGDKYGCKIYASRFRGEIRVFAAHSRSYGCHETPRTERLIDFEIFAQDYRKKYFD